MDFLPLIGLSCFLGLLGFWIVGSHSHQAPAHKVYDQPFEPQPIAPAPDAASE